MLLSFRHADAAGSMASNGRAFSTAARFISRSTAAYRFVVSTLAWPSQWLIVTRVDASLKQMNGGRVA